MEHAIFEQLRFKGFDKIGRRLHKSELAGSVPSPTSRIAENEAGLPQNTRNLKGTITVELRDGILRTSWVDLQQQAKTMVTVVLRQGFCQPKH